MEQDPWDPQITPIRWPQYPVTTLTIILTLIMFPIMPRESSQRRRWPRWWRMTSPACWMSTRGPSPCSTPSGAWCSPPQTSPSRGTGSCSPAEISGDFQTLPRVSGQIRTAGSSQGLGKLKNSFIMFLLYNSHQRLTYSYSNYQYIKGWMMCVFICPVLKTKIGHKTLWIDTITDRTPDLTTCICDQFFLFGGWY